MTETDLAWAAGLFEGEGCIALSPEGLRMILTSTDEDVIRRWGEVVKAGRLYGPYEQKNGVKLLWRWVIFHHSEVLPLWQKLRPWLGQRRCARFDELLSEFTTGRTDKPPAPDCRVTATAITASIVGYMRHYRRGEPACESCLASAALYRASRKKQQVQGE